jgi:hypothetical protein
LEIVKKAIEESLRVMEQFPVNSKFSRAIVLMRLAKEEIKREELQAGIQDTGGERGASREDGKTKGAA